MSRMRLQPRPRKGPKWDCPKKGHSPATETNLDKIVIDGLFFIGNICRFCGCVYYFPNGEKQGLVIQ